MYVLLYNASVTQPDGFTRKYLDKTASKIWPEIFETGV